ncbi:similar to Saccharomyces cerevisiae YBR231C SWC5 Protein of unknown function, component of the SWR1 complex, which exchanges histone variant H2AZ (Htz1p) for chromatin-bound histone H2A [Maudiozyma saulgeensis]|uniref:SWR1-complex protein 5 n=1 Tax=Maudiozyma saulgeensis TaxID=1789683 RepID=A0A1X7RAD9_9SACH|nr:similar to Saccharomyces cerevisiae YBR231C SWC5 Protein of unknown function, component of the SWR1 complex, which exchanges histone variant H2AZ (Htz1p) for chromatin-bound histone H2A [Kazachstania saulgeensis]
MTELDIKKKEADVSSEEEYNEEEDEDFDPTKIDKDNDIDTDSEVETETNETMINNNNVKIPTKSMDYSRIESESGGLVKTRRARLEEEEANKRYKYENIQNTPISDTVKSIWDEMQLQSKKRLSRHQGSNTSIISDIVEDITASSTENHINGEQITIERTYKFAGEVIHEKKIVPRFSAEGQEYLKNSKFNTSETQPREPLEHTSKIDTVTQEERSKLRRPLKREPILEKIIAGSIKPKLTTLEKSKLDWVNYVDKEGITDDLAIHNRDGYLAKQDFLDRVETHKDKKYKEFRKTQLAMQLQNQQK